MPAKGGHEQGRQEGKRGGGAHWEVPGVTEEEWMGAGEEGLVGRGWRGGVGGGVAWSRKENKPSKSEAAFSRRGPDMCLVMQQPPHQPKLGLTEVIKRRGKKGGGKKSEAPPPPPLPSRRV